MKTMVYEGRRVGLKVFLVCQIVHFLWRTFQTFFSCSVSLLKISFSGKAFRFTPELFSFTAEFFSFSAEPFHFSWLWNFSVLLLTSQIIYSQSVLLMHPCLYLSHFLATIFTCCILFMQRCKVLLSYLQISNWMPLNIPILSHSKICSIN